MHFVHTYKNLNIYDKNVNLVKAKKQKFYEVAEIKHRNIHINEQYSIGLLLPKRSPIYPEIKEPIKKPE